MAQWVKAPAAQSDNLGTQRWKQRASSQSCPSSHSPPPNKRHFILILGFSLLPLGISLLGRKKSGIFLVFREWSPGQQSQWNKYFEKFISLPTLGNHSHRRVFMTTNLAGRQAFCSLNHLESGNYHEFLRLEFLIVCEFNKAGSVILNACLELKQAQPYQWTGVNTAPQPWGF